MVESEKTTGYQFFETQNGITLSIPENPPIPNQEGITIQVKSTSPEISPSPKNPLQKLFYALAAAKVTAEGNMFFPLNAWANTRIRKDSVGEDLVEVYGRVPGKESSWRKAVNPQDNQPAQNPQNVIKKNYFERFAKRYFELWQKKSPDINLFNRQIEPETLPDQVDLKGELVEVWKTERYSVVLVSEPHLKGIHLMVYPRNSYWKEKLTRQWRTDGGDEQFVTGTLEATAIALAAQQLIAPGQGEIHNSGNWASGLKTTDEGGKLSLQQLNENPKMELRSHRPDLVEKGKGSPVGANVHVHLYIPEDGGPVVLPTMSKKEAQQRLETAKQEGKPLDVYQKDLALWGKTKPLSQEDFQRVKNALENGKLTQCLIENYQGLLFPSN